MGVVLERTVQVLHAPGHPNALVNSPRHHHSFAAEHAMRGNTHEDIEISRRTATCSGEGGILSECMENSFKYIFEYVPNKYSVTEDNLKIFIAILR